ncbi:MAG: 4Fe-4S binding protein [Deltaproteobacteria bacterium]|jgi:ferredoxin/flavodoxin|nr:4Fe-4S binding protein [Deltaproteobacteria bacterium]
MNIDTVTCIFFSPTGTTKILAEHIARGIGAGRIEMVDCTKRSDRKKCGPFSKGDLVILATPVYYGRIPEEILPYFATLKGLQTPAIPVVVYGNREYDDALKELYDIAVAGGFLPVAAGAFIAQHSYSTPDRPIAEARPDANDLNKAQAFGTDIRKKLAVSESIDAATLSKVPGNVPYVVPKNLNLIKEARKSIPFTPETDENTCIECGQCAETCPTEAVSLNDAITTDRWQCIICFACIKNCPTGARQMKDENFIQAISHLYDLCRERKEPEVFLP